MDHPLSPAAGRTVTAAAAASGTATPGTSPYDLELVRAAREGDRGALEQLLAACLPLLHRVVGRALDGHADTDDVVQEVLLRIVAGLPGLREPERFRSWAVAIAFRQVQQHGRSRRGDLPHRPVDDELPDPAGDFTERTVAEVVMAEQRREVLRATGWLEPADRRLLALWWEETAGVLGRSELSAAMNLPRAHVAVRVQRMKEQLHTARTVVRALSRSPRCPELTVTVRGWDGRPSALWRKRLGRHVRDCPACLRQGEGLVPPELLLPGIVLPVPAGLLAGLPGLLDNASAALSSKAGFGALLDRVTDVFAGFRPRTAAALAAGGAVLLGALVLPVWQSSAPDGTPRSAPTAAPGAPGGPAASATATAPGGDAAAADIVVAPDGSDETGDGSLTRPYATLGKAVGLVGPGRTIALRGGTYRPSEPVTIDTDGTADRPVVLTAYLDERPVLDLSAVPEGQWGVTQRADHWTVRGLEVRGSGSHAWVCSGCAHGVFDGVTMHHNARSGLVLRDAGTVGNTVVDSDFHHNRQGDDGGTGLAIVFGSGTGNTVSGCRVWENGNDGVDLGGFTGPVLLDGNWAYRNGDGFTLGGGGTRAAVAHVVRNNAAWDNEGYGFTDDGNTGSPALERNSAYRNGLAGFRIADAAASLVRNAAWSNGREAAALGPSVRSRGNTWDQGGPSVSLTDLRSGDPRDAEGSRTPDGSLPRTVFLRPRDPAVAVGAPMTDG
jgi:RNA polymerase sigma factor (sigma-70 family)